MTEVAVVGFAHAPHVRRTDGTTNGVEMLMPCFAEIYAELGLKQTDIGFWCSGSSDYLAGPGVLVHLGDRLDRCGAADQRVTRGDGRSLGAVRGLHQVAHRRS